ncbi:hypothetical protein C8R46DRAFT_1300857 [Mycena filopes]|nr:hypothetical protein C8R46DRAFT_1300857 [Mycena filopes]
MTSVSINQPFSNFLDTQAATVDPAAPTSTDTSGDKLATAPLGADLKTAAAELSEELRTSILADVGPASTKRAITRSLTAPAQVASSKKPAAAALTAAKTLSRSPSIEGDTFARYGLQKPPVKAAGGGKGKAETPTEKAGRLEVNLSRLADVLSGTDTRLTTLIAAHDVLSTDVRLRGLVQKSRAPANTEVPAPEETQDANLPADNPSPNPSSVAGYDDDDILGRLDDLEDKIDELLHVTENHTADLQTVLTRTAAPYTLAQLTEAARQQFETITADRDAILRTMETNAVNQAKLNQAYETRLAGLEERAAQTGAAMARRELGSSAPLHRIPPVPTPLPSASAPRPIRPRSRSRSRSRSRPPRSPTPHTDRFRARSRSPPGRDGLAPAGQRRGRSPSTATEHDPKRFRSAAEAPLVTVTVIMGPIRFGGALGPEDALKLHMDTALPDYSRPGVIITVDWVDHFLHLGFTTAREADALIAAWREHGVKGYDDVKMVHAANTSGRSNQWSSASANSNQRGDTSGSSNAPTRHRPPRKNRTSNGNSGGGFNPTHNGDGGAGHSNAQRSRH